MGSSSRCCSGHTDHLRVPRAYYERDPKIVLDLGIDLPFSFVDYGFSKPAGFARPPWISGAVE
jgi:hypothetical protein